MIYLEDDDFTSQISSDKLLILQDGSDTVMDNLELAVISEITPYLSSRYDAAGEFAKTGDSRWPINVLYAVDMLLYHLYSRINPNDIPELRMRRYERAMRFYEKIAKGILNAPLIESTTSADNVRWGSNPKIGNCEYGNGY